MTQKDSDFRNNSEKCLYNSDQSAENNILKMCVKTKIVTKNVLIDTLNHANSTKNVNSWQRVCVYLAMPMILLSMTNLVLR